MNVDPRGIVYALKRAVRKQNNGQEEFLTEVIIGHLERLEKIEAAGTIRICVECHQVAEAVHHPDDAPDECPSCFEPWTIYSEVPPEKEAGHE